MISQTKLNRLATRQSNQNKKGVIKVIDQSLIDSPNSISVPEQDQNINSEKKDLLRKSIGRSGNKSSKKDKSQVIS